MIDKTKANALSVSLFCFFVLVELELEPLGRSLIRAFFLFRFGWKFLVNLVGLGCMYDIYTVYSFIRRAGK